jgi:DNA-binding MarR family transcriptional regulator
VADLQARVLELLPRLFAAAGPRPTRGGPPGAGAASAPDCPTSSGVPPTPLQLRASLHLTRAGAARGLTVSELAGALGLSISRASHLADELERDGMLTRERDAADRRVVRLFPSEWARSMGQRLIDHQADAIARALEQTPARERAAAARFLERLVAEFEEHA